MRSLRLAAALAALASVTLAADARPARGDAFLIKGGGRVYGQLVEQYKDVHDQKWLRVKAAFGTVEIPRKMLAKHVKTKVARNVLRLEEAAVHGLTGTVELSGDGGDTWRVLRLAAAEGETVADTRFPIPLAPGNRVRTGKASAADLDVGYGLVRLEAESEVELLAVRDATISVLGGRAGVRVDEKAGKREFRVETPQATMGVRGTAFAVTVAEGRTRVAVGEGTVRIDRTDIEEGGIATVGEDGVPVVDTSGLTSDDEDFLAALAEGSLFPRIDWVVLPGGTYEMGEAREPFPSTFDHRPGAEVTLPPFLMSRTEITVAHYRAFRKWVAVYGEAPLRPPGTQGPLAPDTEPRRDPPLDPREPAQVAWLPAAAFARFAGGRLASEAEWEWAAFLGEDWDYPWGTDASRVFENAWVGVNSGDRLFEEKELSLMAERGEDHEAAMREARCRPRPVGTKLPAPSGVHDLVGNVEEWCADRGEDGYQGVPRDGTPRRTGSTSMRPARGWRYLTPSAWHPRMRIRGNAVTGRRGIRVVVRFDD